MYFLSIARPTEGQPPIDIDKVVREKMWFNESRPHKHGRKY
jgi:hypothetical protein